MSNILNFHSETNARLIDENGKLRAALAGSITLARDLCAALHGKVEPELHPKIETVQALLDDAEAAIDQGRIA